MSRHVFISYARTDRSVAELLATALRDAGFEVWWDPEILPGERFARVIQEALDGAMSVIALWSHALPLRSPLMSKSTEAVASMTASETDDLVGDLGATVRVLQVMLDDPSIWIPLQEGASSANDYAFVPLSLLP